MSAHQKIAVTTCDPPTGEIAGSVAEVQPRSEYRWLGADREGLRRMAMRGEQVAAAATEASRLALLIDSLLCGRILDQWSLWEVANRLRLPGHGPYVVVAAALPGV